MKIIALLLALLLFGSLLEAQNLQGIWKMKEVSKIFEGDRDLWLVIDTDSDSVYTGHSVTVFYSSFGGNPDTIVAQIRGYADKKKKRIYVEEEKIIKSKTQTQGGLEKFTLTYVSGKRKKHLRGKVESPDAFLVYLNTTGKNSEVAEGPRDIEFSKL